MSLLEAVNEYPLAGLIVLAALLLVQQILAKWKGGSDASRNERESLKLAKQISETVNSYKAETQLALSSIKEHMVKNDIGHVSARLDDAVRMLATMADHQGECLGTLDRVSGLVRSIADDLQKTDSRIVHEQIQGKVLSVEALIKDVKRIVLDK